MSFQERRALVSLISTILITTVYSAYMIQQYPSTDAYSPAVFHFWGTFFLILIPVSIVARIIIHIIFSILNTVATKEDEPHITDERDKLFELRATRNSLYVFAGGFLLAMGSLVMAGTPTTMFILLFAAGFMAELVSEGSQFYFYRRGF
jgi:hypothetical protein